MRFTLQLFLPEFPELSGAAETHFHSPKSLFQEPAEGIAMGYHPPPPPPSSKAVRRPAVVETWPSTPAHIYSKFLPLGIIHS